MKKTIQFVIDKNHENYRQCPECEKEFMTDHQSRKFCSVKCHYTYNNRTKRLEKHELDLLRGEAIRLNQINASSIKSSFEVVSKREKNVSILSSLSFIAQDCQIEFVKLFQKGYDFFTYDIMHPHLTGEANYFTIANYELFLITRTKVLVHQNPII